MLSMQVDGKLVNPSNPGEVQAALNTAIVENIKSQLHEALSAVCDPATGEFAIVSVQGDSLEHLTVSIDGSETVKALATARLREFGVAATTEDAVTAEEPKPIYAFLSHAGADAELAKRLAEDLNAQGIEVFLDRWDIRAGDSIPGKINEALAKVSHFLVLLTPASEGSRWVHAEMDAGLMRRVDGHCVFIAIRHGVAASSLPPLIRSWASPSLDDYKAAVSQLISDIHGISRRPPLGPLPSVVDTARRNRTGLSDAAFVIARLFIETSEHGLTHDPAFGAEEFRATVGLTDDDIRDGVHELEGRGLIKALRGIGGTPASHAVGFVDIGPDAKLFAAFDQYVKSWNPVEDAQRVAADLINGVVQGSAPQMAEHYGWPPRRLNPAIAYLQAHRLVMSSQSLGSHPWYSAWVQATDDTRRFVKGRSL